MKLSKLYSNKPFQNIKFNTNQNKVNIIIGDSKKKETEKDQHNLGKSRILILIDFLLLKKKHSDLFLFTTKSKKDENQQRSESNLDKSKIKADLEKGSLLFQGYEFFLEILLNTGNYLVIKRTIDNPTKISFKHIENTDDSFVCHSVWDEENVPIEKAKERLNELLNFDFSRKFHIDFRKLVNYSLRMQGDYDYQRNSIFQLSKFKGKDKDWKPLMFALLGFNNDIPLRKYNLENKILEYRNLVREQKNTFDIDPTEVDSLVGQKQVKEQEYSELQNEIENFNFYNQDREIIDNLVGNLENNISALNSKLYNVEYDISKLNQSIKNGFSFDTEKIKTLFEEFNVFFPNQLLKSYEQLVDFNKRITQERNEQIRDSLSKKQLEVNKITDELMSLNAEREKYRDILNDIAIIKKYKEYQKKIVKLETELLQIQTKLDSIQKIEAKDIEIKATIGKELEGVIEQLKITISSTEKNEKYTQIRKLFSDITRKITHSPAYISMALNQNSNIEFECKYENSAKDEGTTYYKLLCIAFDIAIQSVYSSESYFRFIFHDDAFANLANTRRIDLLKTVREYSNKYNIQYVFSIIKDDIPPDFTYDDDEVILELHDKNDSGKLFYMNF
ncbi:DUF2326 domain-containing protein [Leptospira bandrabouensis]|uniref:DUF2326 domain-containing protein n=1 Tax=Leptospira bandrabouensis TaxID=2484903 RepID=A0A6H3NVR8_9LEPT|nr:DUF2326 domain-containing protein [Leptospira bandrabouensis]TGN13455.1 DUF2326 domain-containing protein [Leptospira bandrabouensis]